MTIIRENLFENCKSLKTIVIPKSVTIIRADAFTNCPNLETVYYTGTESEWRSINIGPYNGLIDVVTKVYNYVP